MFLFLLLVSAFYPAPTGALDYGLALNQTVEAASSPSALDAGNGLSGALAYTPALVPWVSGFLGDRFSFYLSGKIGFEYRRPFEGAGGDSGWRDPAVLPELERTELVWQASPSLTMGLGRRRFRDPSGLVASGLFDGLDGDFSAGGGRFSAGLYYTGFLYRDTADIIMTDYDRDEYQTALSLEGGYFASRRLFGFLGWEHHGLGPASSLALGLLAQFDLNGEEDRFNSRYLSARYGHRLPLGFDTAVTAVLGLGEEAEEGPKVFFAGILEGSWLPPFAPDNKLALRFLYSSPSHRQMGPFIPLSSVPQGQVFGPPAGGLSVVRGAWTLRPLPVLSLTAEGSYFIRTDTVTFRDNRDHDRLKGEGYCLGGEVYGAVQWTPLPDLALSAGGGAFFPSLGNAFSAGAAVRWKAVFGIILSL
jgi:hypothetical protein